MVPQIPIQSIMSAARLPPALNQCRGGGMSTGYIISRVRAAGSLVAPTEELKTQANSELQLMVASSRSQLFDTTPES